LELKYFIKCLKTSLTSWCLTFDCCLNFSRGSSHVLDFQVLISTSAWKSARTNNFYFHRKIKRAAKVQPVALTAVAAPPTLCPVLTAPCLYLPPHSPPPPAPSALSAAAPEFFTGPPPLPALPKTLLSCMALTTSTLPCHPTGPQSTAESQSPPPGPFMIGWKMMQILA
jgi:hypothetical protein